MPALAKVDVIRGVGHRPGVRPGHVHGARHGRGADVRRAPGARAGPAHATTSASVDDPFYVRLRGSDGKRTAAGLNGADVDPAGPAMDVVGDADPWADLWFYTNPIWVLPPTSGH